HGGGHSRAVGRARVELRLRRPHLQCAASLVGIDPSANRHQCLSLLPILAISSPSASRPTTLVRPSESVPPVTGRSEEHTSELQSRFDLVCRLLLEKKKKYLDNNQ